MLRLLLFCIILLLFSCVTKRVEQNGNTEKGKVVLKVLKYQKKKCVGCPYTYYLGFKEVGTWTTYDSTGNVLKKTKRYYNESPEHSMKRYRKNEKKMLRKRKRFWNRKKYPESGTFPPWDNTK